jgi:hypothetical protein
MHLEMDIATSGTSSDLWQRLGIGGTSIARVEKISESIPPLMTVTG